MNEEKYLKVKIGNYIIDLSKIIFAGILLGSILNIKHGYLVALIIIGFFYIILGFYLIEKE